MYINLLLCFNKRVSTYSIKKKKKTRVVSCVSNFLQNLAFTFFKVTVCFHIGKRTDLFLNLKKKFTSMANKIDKTDPKWYDILVKMQQLRTAVRVINVREQDLVMKLNSTTTLINVRIAEMAAMQPCNPGDVRPLELDIRALQREADDYRKQIDDLRAEKERHNAELRELDLD